MRGRVRARYLVAHRWVFGPFRDAYVSLPEVQLGSALVIGTTGGAAGMLVLIELGVHGVLAWAITVVAALWFTMAAACEMAVRARSEQ